MIKTKTPPNQQGLTLIEVLIALAIISIAMMAIIKTSSENIRATHYLTDKSAALWVSQTVMNELHLGLRTFTSTNQELNGSMPMLKQTWLWQAKQSDSPNPRIKKVIITVFRNEESKEQEQSIFTLESFQLHTSEQR